MNSFFDGPPAFRYRKCIRVDHDRSSLANQTAAKNEGEETIEKLRIETILVSDRGIYFSFFNNECCVLPSRVVRDVIHENITTPLLVNGGMKAFEIRSILQD